MLVVGDYLYIYCSGRAGEARGKGNPVRYEADASMGLAVLRRDGFASLDAGKTEGTLTTRKVRFNGKHLFVNVDALAGELRVEVLDAAGKVIAPFTRENCAPVKTNATLQAITWEGATDLSKVAGQEVRFRFSLTNGSLFAFWVSSDKTDSSNGYVGAGGPGFTSHRDTTGTAAYTAARSPLVHAGPDQTVRDEAGQGSATVTLDGTKSVAHDGAIKSFEWRENGKVIGKGSKAAVKLLVGSHTLTLAATDEKGAVGYGGVRVKVLPREDPVPPRDRLVLWLKADAITDVKDGAPLSVWPDSSKNGLDPFQPEAAKRPIWKERVVKGLPAVRFDGVDDVLRTHYYRDLLSTSYKVSVFAVFKPSGGAGARGLVSANFTALATTTERGGSLVYTTAYQTPEGKTAWVNVNASQERAIKPDRWTIGAVLRSGSEPGQTRLFVNGVRTDDGTAIAYHAINAAHGFIGCLRGEMGCWQGDLAEILIYSEALSEEDAQAVQRYLGRKYGLDGK